MTARSQTDILVQQLGQLMLEITRLQSALEAVQAELELAKAEDLKCEVDPTLKKAKK